LKDEVRRFLEAIKRKELKGVYKEELDNAKTSLWVDEDLSILKTERCQLLFDSYNNVDI
jgi:hypothetical protein